MSYDLHEPEGDALMELHVLDHHHDALAGLYRLEVGIPVYRSEPMFDSDGGVLLGDGGEPIMDLVLDGYSDRWDYVFADDAEQWAGLEPEAIAAEQRRIVADALNEQVEEFREENVRQAAARTPLPGAGGVL